MINSKVMERCSELDLQLIKKNAVSKLGWSADKAEQVEQEYKRFLALCYSHVGTMVPTADIDAFWELHIQDTAKYARDCDVVFGFFLHHIPNYLTKNANASQGELDQRFEDTLDLYRSAFGEPLRDTARSGCEDCIPDYDPPKPPPPPVSPRVQVQRS